MWEAHIERADALLAKITPAQIEDVKLRRAQEVAHSTVDKDLAVLKAFFNWCIGAQSGRIESRPSREVLQRGQLAAPISHDGGVRPASARRRKTIETSPLPRREDHPGRAHGPAPRQPVPPRWDQMDFAQPRHADSADKERPASRAAAQCDGAHDAAGAVQRSAMPDCPVRLPARDGPQGRRAGPGRQERVSHGARDSPRSKTSPGTTCGTRSPRG